MRKIVKNDREVRVEMPHKFCEFCLHCEGFIWNGFEVGKVDLEHFEL